MQTLMYDSLADLNEEWSLKVIMIPIQGWGYYIQGVWMIFTFMMNTLMDFNEAISVTNRMFFYISGGPTMVGVHAVLRA